MGVDLTKIIYHRSHSWLAARINTSHEYICETVKKRKQFSLATVERTTNFSNIARRFGSYLAERSNLASVAASLVFLLGHRLTWTGRYSTFHEIELKTRLVTGSCRLLLNRSIYTFFVDYIKYID